MYERGIERGHGNLHRFLRVIRGIKVIVQYVVVYQQVGFETEDICKLISYILIMTEM